jgi:hypothetical protein
LKNRYVTNSSENGPKIGREKLENYEWKSSEIMNEKEEILSKEGMNKRVKILNERVENDVG